jgi:hypothetical protein
MAEIKSGIRSAGSGLLVWGGGVKSGLDGRRGDGGRGVGTWSQPKVDTACAVANIMIISREVSNNLIFISGHLF